MHEKWPLQAELRLQENKPSSFYHLMDIILRNWKSSLVQYKSPQTPTKYARYIPSNKTRVKYKIDTTR